MTPVFRRRTALAGAGLGAIAVTACSGAEPVSREPGEEIVAAADVPVGSGVIVGDVVITQPAAGQYQGFSAICTHTGCLLNKIDDATINCPCHGSQFSLDGAVVSGPAQRPLTTVNVRVQGDSIVWG
ncbi:ubiquinol-cytochrome c reductase iron-sulfur subunit [Mycobacterium sp. SMC-4]|uniref:QcrA and Rieske domain-containing protein n=1 Tax=Mycobacterium sp. SMC-4 TaxID=2857059 RepID=UPI0021B36E99|nr:Rieske (2Fe-2S) protein [Mycobacterium sp. SMC-4]UXA19331.1 Rieske (2Fe-2S) protein [Mycobacterium sp. SMC-4]